MAAAFFGILGSLACTSATNGNPALPPSGNGGSSIGGTGMPPPPSGNVIVEIQDPQAGMVMPAGSLFDVRAVARIDQGTDYVDPTSVLAQVTAAGDSAVLESSKLAPQGMDVFTGRISLGDLPSGDYVLTVTATSSGGQHGVSEPLAFQIDAGPTLVVRSPLAFHSYKGLLVIEVVADPGLYGPLDGPYATVANYPVVLSPVGDPADNIYRGMIDLNDPMPGTIVPPLQNEQLLTVWASNANHKRVDVHLVFVVDDEGPSITMTTPVPGDVVGNIIRISANVDDPAGVLDSSVIAVIGDDTTPALFSITLKPDGLGVYSVLFDTRKLTQCPDPPSSNDICIVFPTISFRASDELGNERVVSYDFAVDNVAPVADLDPPKLRSFAIDQAGYRCSYEFDPLGVDIFRGDMPNDATMVPQVFDLRARVEDDGNHAHGLKLTPLSLVDPLKTSVYVLDDTDQALIVDTDGDGWCDAINPLLVPTTEPPVTNDQVLKVRLSPLMPAGKGNFLPDSSLPISPGPAGPGSVCLPGIDTQPPAVLCTLAQPTIAIGYAFGNPAIWTVEPIDKAHCFGNQFDTKANNISEGWACIAVATGDYNDNVSVSPPLRVNIQYQYNGQHACACPNASGQNCCTGASGPPPACTGTYDRVTKMVTKGPCKTRRFERQQNLEDYYCLGLECPGPFVPR